MLEDRLYTLFEQQLYSKDCAQETQEEFVYKVVERYVMGLLSNGHVPIQFLPTMQVDLEEEVQEMFQKKTYGFYSLDEFRKAQG